MTGVELIALMLVLLYPTLILSSLGIIAWKNWKNDDSIRIEWQSVAKFLAFMVFLTMLRVCFADIIDGLFPGYIQEKIGSIAGQVPMGQLAFVFWEDVWFGMPIAWLMRKVYPKYPKLAITGSILISAVFMSGHFYQGAMGAITIVYPFFISYRYGKKYGFGTVMVCHMLYDFISLSTAKIVLALLG